MKVVASVCAGIALAASIAAVNSAKAANGRKDLRAGIRHRSARQDQGDTERADDTDANLRRLGELHDEACPGGVRVE